MAEGHEISLTPNFVGVSGLEKFIDRLSPGMEVEGRIVDVLDENIIILRIWGNNILTETNYSFRKFDEVILQVKGVHPKLVFRIRPLGAHQSGALYA